MKRALLLAAAFLTAAPLAHAQPAPPAPAPEPEPDSDPDDDADADADADADPADPADPDAAADDGYIGRSTSRLEVDDCPVPPDLEPAALDALAREHYARAEVLYLERGDYHGAIREFVATYCAVPAYYTVLKDVGQAYERLLDYEKAVDYLERYVAEIPDDTPGAADKRRSVAVRAKVLQDLPARISVATTPQGATVSFTDAYDVRQNAGPVKNDTPFEIKSGQYVMTVELPGHDPVSQRIEPRIGQAYSYFFALQPKRGHLVVSAEPADARIFLDDRLVGIGRYEDELAGGIYDVTIEAQGRISEARQVEVVADRDTDVPVKLSAKPSSGRTQLLIATSIAGGIIGGVALDVLEQSNTTAGLAGAGGVALGFVGGYFGIPADIEVGHSSFIITASVIGAAEAGLIISLTTSNPADAPIATVAVGGLAAGAIFGALTAERFGLDAGDAALINTGALWGSIGGGLFAVVFESKDRVSQALVLGGLNLGIVTGALLGRQVEVSRRHVALIDLAGLAGMGIAVSIQSAADDARNSATDPDDPDDVTSERTAHFALAGMGAGLALGAVLTRNMDAPKLNRVTPVIGASKDPSGVSTTTFGIRGSF